MTSAEFDKYLDDLLKVSKKTNEQSTQEPAVLDHLTQHDVLKATHDLTQNVAVYVEEVKALTDEQRRKLLEIHSHISSISKAAKLKVPLSKNDFIRFLNDIQKAKAADQAEPEAALDQVEVQHAASTAAPPDREGDEEAEPDAVPPEDTHDSPENDAHVEEITRVQEPIQRNEPTAEEADAMEVEEAVGGQPAQTGESEPDTGEPEADAEEETEEAQAEDVEMESEEAAQAEDVDMEQPAGVAQPRQHHEDPVAQGTQDDDVEMEPAQEPAGVPEPAEEAEAEDIEMQEEGTEETAATGRQDDQAVAMELEEGAAAQGTQDDDVEMEAAEQPIEAAETTDKSAQEPVTGEPEADAVEEPDAEEAHEELTGVPEPAIQEGEQPAGAPSPYRDDEEDTDEEDEAEDKLVEINLDDEPAAEEAQEEDDDEFAEYVDAKTSLATENEEVTEAAQEEEEDFSNFFEAKGELDTPNSDHDDEETPAESHTEARQAASEQPAQQEEQSAGVHAADATNAPTQRETLPAEEPEPAAEGAQQGEQSGAPEADAANQDDDVEMETEEVAKTGGPDAPEAQEEDADMDLSDDGVTPNEPEAMDIDEDEVAQELTEGGAETDLEVQEAQAHESDTGEPAADTEEEPEHDEDASAGWVEDEETPAEAHTEEQQAAGEQPAQQEEQLTEEPETAVTAATQEEERTREPEPDAEVATPPEEPPPPRKRPKGNPNLMQEAVSGIIDALDKESKARAQQPEEAQPRAQQEEPEASAEVATPPEQPPQPKENSPEMQAALRKAGAVGGRREVAEMRLTTLRKEIGEIANNTPRGKYLKSKNPQLALEDIKKWNQRLEGFAKELAPLSRANQAKITRCYSLIKWMSPETPEAQAQPQVTEPVKEPTFDELLDKIYEAHDRQTAAEADIETPTPPDINKLIEQTLASYYAEQTPPDAEHEQRAQEGSEPWDTTKGTDPWDSSISNLNFDDLVSEQREQNKGKGFDQFDEPPVTQPPSDPFKDIGLQSTGPSETEEPDALDSLSAAVEAARERLRPTEPQEADAPPRPIHQGVRQRRHSETEDFPTPMETILETSEEQAQPQDEEEHAVADDTEAPTRPTPKEELAALRETLKSIKKQDMPVITQEDLNKWGAQLQRLTGELGQLFVNKATIDKCYRVMRDAAKSNPDLNVPEQFGEEQGEYSEWVHPNFQASPEETTPGSDPWAGHGHDANSLPPCEHTTAFKAAMAEQTSFGADAGHSHETPLQLMYVDTKAMETARDKLKPFARNCNDQTNLVGITTGAIQLTERIERIERIYDSGASLEDLTSYKKHCTRLQEGFKNLDFSGEQSEMSTPDAEPPAIDIQEQVNVFKRELGNMSDNLDRLISAKKELDRGAGPSSPSPV